MRYCASSLIVSVSYCAVLKEYCAASILWVACHNVNPPLKAAQKSLPSGCSFWDAMTPIPIPPSTAMFDGDEKEYSHKSE